MSKLTIDQKRLETLRRQLYGKEKDTDFKKSALTTKKPLNLNTSSNSPITQRSTPLSHSSTTDTTKDIGYLKKDLFKVLFLTITALGAQLILYFTPLKSILNVKFF